MFSCSLVFLATPALAFAQQPSSLVRHELDVRVHPDAGALEFTDTIRLPSKLRAAPRFRLHAGLEVALETPGWGLTRFDSSDAEPTGGAPVELYELRPPPNGRGGEPTLRIKGVIEHALEAYGDESARSFADSHGTIGPEGVYLSGASKWLPDFGDTLLEFRMTVALPAGWDAVSQGQREEHAHDDSGTRVTWSSPEPMEEVYLIANRFIEYDGAAGAVAAQVFLLQEDPNLAAKYLEATAQYLAMYRDLIGPYPFAKFALVENFWETGYGMPSFTLLGSSVIRFPFILHSSYPHEILHNWWGNSVYVEHESGNWCEGLTAYLADHLIKEGQGQGVDYRRDSLKKYRDYVQGGGDFPLSEFRSRHSSATEAVGYGKALMVFHMLRRELGDELFTEGLRRFYEEQQYQRASWADLEQVFSGVAKRDLAPFFSQWVERTGAPELGLAVATTPGELQVTVLQFQGGEPYALEVPLAITLQDVDEARIETLSIDEETASFTFEVAGPVTRVDLDPWFDVFRRLDRSELPPTLGELFGAPALTIVLPTANTTQWEALAESWQDDPNRVQIVGQNEIEVLPNDRCVWLLGRDNVWAHALTESLPGERLDESTPESSFVYTARHPADPNLALGWVTTDLPAAIPGLARKLPHYGKYSFLAFQGDEPTNSAKGQWAATDSPLVAFPEAPRAALEEREPLARPAPVFDPNRLIAHVGFLASDELEGRGLGTPGLESAGDYIAAAFEEAGLQPGGDDGSFFQSWTETDGPEGTEITLRNVVGVLPGTDAGLAGQSVVLGAHYDHLGRGWPDVRSGNEGQIHNGADDNASGVAVLIETAHALAGQLEPARSLVFVAFSGEEWGLRGARHYAAAGGPLPAAESFAMVNLDAVGRFADGGLTVLGCGTADEWRHIAMGVGFTTGVQSSCVADDPGGSDQVVFHELGVPAVQLFTGAHADYHRPSDDVEKVDADGLVQVATWVRETLVYLTERVEPLTSKLAGAAERAPADAPSGERRVSLGTVPAFGFEGPGVLVDSVLDDSPAARAGIQGGDILIAIDDEELDDLRAFSDELKRHAPGDTIRILIDREGEELELEATLVAR